MAGGRGGEIHPVDTVKPVPGGFPVGTGQSPQGRYEGGVPTLGLGRWVSSFLAPAPAFLLLPSPSDRACDPPLTDEFTQVRNLG